MEIHDCHTHITYLFDFHYILHFWCIFAFFNIFVLLNPKSTFPLFRQRLEEGMLSNGAKNTFYLIISGLYFMGEVK